jgi:hypothetical protein
MPAVTRWVQYDIAEEGSHSTGPNIEYGLGTRGSSIAVASVGDSFNISTGNRKLYLKVDGSPGSHYGLTLSSGVELDPRFVAKDISERMQDANQGGGWDHAQCFWNNGQLEIYSGTPGSASSVDVASGTDTAHIELGWSTTGAGGGTGGLVTGNGNDGNYITTSGTYSGFFDEEYKIVINIENPIQTPTKDGSNTYTGTLTTGGMYNGSPLITYTIQIDTSGGRTTMNAGTGNVPIMKWSSNPTTDQNLTGIELLYADHWYNLGTRGLMVKFSDAIFNTTATAWDIVCNAADYAQGANPDAAAGTAQFVYGSNRGDDLAAAISTSATSWVQLGTRGVYVKWTTVANLSAGDEYRVICKPPMPSSYDITNLNYGNVTVSTESPVKAVMFEILSGAVEISTVKFGLQAHGNFSHHGEGLGDTYFRFGTLGPGNNGGLSPLDGLEWQANVTSADIVSGVSFFSATDPQLSVVADADNSETLGVSTYAGMVADPIWLNIKLGTSEVGANSTINYRIYFDYA